MAHCPVCNADVEDVDEHATEEAQKGDQPHKEAVEKKQSSA